MRVTRFDAFLAFAVVAGLLLQVILAHSRGAWFDESFSLRMVSFPVGEMMHRISLDHTPPFYYLALHAWLRLTEGDLFVARFPSLFGGAVTACGAYFLFRSLYGRCRTREAALFSSAACALNPLLLDAASECRMYSFLSALTVLSSLSLLKALKSNTKHWWCAYGVAAVLLGYTHYFGLFVLASHVVVVVCDTGRRIRMGDVPAARKRLASLALVAVAWLLTVLPYAPVFLRQRDQARTDFWIPPLSWTRLATSAHEALVRPYSNQPMSSSELYAVCLVFLAVPLILCYRPRRGDSALLVLMAVPPGLAALVSMLDVPVFNARYLSGAVALWAVGAGGVSLRIADVGMRRIAQVGALALSFAVALEFLWFASADAQNGPRSAARFVDSNRKPTEPVFCESTFVFMPALVHTGIEDGWHLVTFGKRHHYAGTAVLAPEMSCDESCVAEALAKTDRAWIVDPVGPRPAWMPLDWSVEREEWISDRHRAIMVRAFSRTNRQAKREGRE